MYSLLTQLAAGVLVLAFSASALPASDGSSLTTNVTNCLNSYQVPFEDSTSSNWTSLITPYNLRLFWYPAIVTLPYTPQHVSASVICAAAAGLKVQAKSGGHSYASYSSGGQNGSLIVDLQNFNGVSVNNATGIATVGGGVRLGNLALDIYAQGQRALPHGTCPGVGIGGHFTHGGYGHSSRLWGLGLDTIVALDVVLANGSYIHVTPTQYPSIYFAMRGAADSFGIAVNFYLQTHPAPWSVINFSASIPQVLDNATIVTEALLGLQTTVADPSYINGNISFGIYTDSSGAFSLSGWCIECDVSTFNSITFPKLLESFPPPSSQSATPLGWIDSLTNLANGEALNVPLYGYDMHDTFYAKSIVTKEAAPPTHAEWLGFWTFVTGPGRSAPNPWYSIINLYGGAGSQINVPPANASAYSDRDALWVFQNYASHASPFPTSTVVPFLDNLTSSLAAGNNATDFGIYLNYADPDLSARQVARLGYGTSTYERLLAIKRRVDPRDVFWNPQAVGNVGLAEVMDG